MTGEEFARQKANERSKQYYAEHTEERKAYSKAYYQAHKERYAELQRIRRAKNRKPKGEKKTADMVAYKRAWRAAHPDYGKQRYAAHREEILEKKRAKRAARKEEAV